MLTSLNEKRKEFWQIASTRVRLITCTSRCRIRNVWMIMSFFNWKMRFWNELSPITFFFISLMHLKIQKMRSHSLDAFVFMFYYNVAFQHICATWLTKTKLLTWGWCNSVLIYFVNVFRKIKIYAGSTVSSQFSLCSTVKVEIFARLIFCVFLLSRTTSLHTFWHNIHTVLFLRLTILPRNAWKFPLLQYASRFSMRFTSTTVTLSYIHVQVCHKSHIGPFFTN